MTDTTAPAARTTLLALAALKGKLHTPHTCNDPRAGAVHYWYVSASTDQVMEYCDGESTPVVVDMPSWERLQFAKDLKAAFDAGQAQR